MEAAAQSSIFANDFATASLFLWLKVFPIPPQICLFQIQILIVGFFQDLFFVGKFQKMVGFVKFVVAGIDEVFFALRLACIPMQAVSPRCELIPIASQRGTVEIVNTL